MTSLFPHLSARFIRPLSQRASFDGIWLLGLLTYKYTADTCFSILRCQKVSGVSGEFVRTVDCTRCLSSYREIHAKALLYFNAQQELLESFHECSKNEIVYHTNQVFDATPHLGLNCHSECKTF